METAARVQTDLEKVDTELQAAESRLSSDPTNLLLKAEREKLEAKLEWLRAKCLAWEKDGATPRTVAEDPDVKELRSAFQKRSDTYDTLLQRPSSASAPAGTQGTGTNLAEFERGVNAVLDKRLSKLKLSDGPFGSLASILASEVPGRLRVVEEPQWLVTPGVEPPVFNGRHEKWKLKGTEWEGKGREIVYDLDNQNRVLSWNLGKLGEVKKTAVHTLMNAFIEAVSGEALFIRPHDNKELLEEQKPDHLLLSREVPVGVPSPVDIRAIFDDKGADSNIGNLEITQAYKYAQNLLKLDRMRAKVVVALMSLKECIVLRFKRGAALFEQLGPGGHNPRDAFRVFWGFLTASDQDLGYPHAGLRQALSDRTDIEVEGFLGKGACGSVYEVKGDMVLKVFGRAGHEAGDCLKEEDVLKRLADADVPGVPRVVKKLGTTALLLSPLGWQSSLSLQGAKSLVATLKAIHEAGLVHRDLRPCNLVTTEGGSAVIIDWGAAGPIDSTEQYCGSMCAASDKFLLLHRDGEWPEGSAYTAKDDLVAAIRTVALILLGKKKARAVQGAAGSLASRGATAWDFWHSDDKTELTNVSRGAVQGVVEAVEAASNPYSEAEKAMSAVWRHLHAESKGSEDW